MDYIVRRILVGVVLVVTGIGLTGIRVAGAVDREEDREDTGSEARAVGIDAPADLRLAEAYRGPVELVLSEDESWAITANELSNSISLISLVDRSVLNEIQLDGRPASICRLGENEVLVSCREAGQVHRIGVHNGRLEMMASFQVGFEPLGIAALGDTAFVGLQATGEVAELNLLTQSVVRRLPVGNWPRHLALSPDGTRLAVGLSGDSSVAVMDTATGEVLYEEPLSGGINLGQMRVSTDGNEVYFPWMIYRSNPITVGNIRRGWVLASRVAKVRLDGPQYRRAISLDVPGLAVADPYGIALTSNGARMTVTSAGTHELLVYRLPDVPFVGEGGPGDLIDNRMLRDKDLFYRIELGGRPLGVQPSRDNERVYVANHLLDAIQVVNLATREIETTISLGDSPDDPEAQKIHLGMKIFYDARRSLDQWYSCHSCHLDGGSNAKAMDTWNDGTELTAKTVLPLFGVTETGPWTWHGWQHDLDASLQNSFVSTMQGRKASEGEIDALRTYLSTLDNPANPFAGSGVKEASEQVARGEKLFASAEVGCAQCHSGPRFTDGEVHDVGLGRDSDKYSGFNTPSLLGNFRKTRFLHDGRAKTLESVLTKWHTPQEVGGGAELDADQLADLIAYLRTL